MFGAIAGIKSISDAIAGISGVISTLTKGIADAKIASINAATEKDRIAADERVKALQAERDVQIAQLQAQTAVMQTALAQINETMREEIKPENRHWFYTGWRPASGWVFVFIAAMFGACLIYATILDGSMLKRVDEAWKIYSAYFAVLAAMVGVYVVARSTDKANGVSTSTRTQKP